MVPAPLVGVMVAIVVAALLGLDTVTYVERARQHLVR